MNLYLQNLMAIPLVISREDTFFKDRSWLCQEFEALNDSLKSNVRTAHSYMVGTPSC